MSEEAEKKKPDMTPEERVKEQAAAPKEVFVVELAMGEKTCNFEAKFDQPASAIAAITALAAVLAPEVGRYRITRAATGDILCDVPLERLLAQIGPSINDLTGKPIVPHFKVVGAKQLDNLKEGKAEFLKKRKEERESAEGKQ